MKLEVGTAYTTKRSVFGLFVWDEKAQVWEYTLSIVNAGSIVTFRQNKQLFKQPYCVFDLKTQTGSKRIAIPKGAIQAMLE